MSALDMHDPKDRATVRKAIADWPRRFLAISPEKRTRWINDLDDIRSSALALIDGAPTDIKLKAIAEVRSCVATSAAIDAVEMRGEMAVAAARLKDLHHIEKMEQEDRHHREGQRVHKTEDVRILIADARGNTRQGTADDIRRAALGSALPALEAGGGHAEPSPKPPGDGGATGGEDPA